MRGVEGAAGGEDRLARLADAFRRFSLVECRGYCRFYEDLSLRIADEPAILALCERRLPGQPAPNVLFGAVRRLLLRGDPHPLGRHYARAAREGTAADGTSAWPDFRDFCHAHREEIARLVESRRVQTNEVGRCAAFLVALASVIDPPAAPVALLDVGTSAGLNLLLDRYGYRFRLPDGRTLAAGAPDSAVVLDCEVRGGRPPVPSAPPRVVARLGIDLHPVDVRRDDEVLWLRALIWPDRPERERRLLDAVAIARRERLDLREGNAADLLPGAIEDLPKDALVCVLQSAFRHQLTASDRARVEGALRDASRRRPLVRVATESPDGRDFDVVVTAPLSLDERLVGRAHPHGLWLEWFA
jgi:hypothetical protein